MAYQSLRQCVDDLARTGQLVRIEDEIDPHLEAAEIQRRVYQAGGPAVYFARVKGCRFPMVSNLFGTLERARFLFRDTLEAVRRLVELKVDPGAFWRRPWRYLGVPRTALHMLPRRVRGGPVLAHADAPSSELPQLRCWPHDGGAFVTLPQVYTEDPDRPGWRALEPRHVPRAAVRRRTTSPTARSGCTTRSTAASACTTRRRSAAASRFRVNVFVGGPPAMTLAAVMPLPEGLPELAFAGALGGRRVRLASADAATACRSHAEADFCIVGTVDPTARKPEGPFGDHLGYYSLAHDFPVLKVEQVYHRDGRDLAVHGRRPAAAGGHHVRRADPRADRAGDPDRRSPASRRCTPSTPPACIRCCWRSAASATCRTPAPRPQELLTQANAILGQGQLSLAKYLLIVAARGRPGARHPRHRRASSATCSSGSTGAATCTSRPARRSTRSTTRATGSTRARSW